MNEDQQSIQKYSSQTEVASVMSVVDQAMWN